MELYGRYARLFGRTAVALASLWWIYARLPLAGELLRRFASVLASPLSVFVICHVIVASLIAESGKLSLRSRSREHEDPPAAVKPESESDSVGETRGDEIVFVDKEVVSETTTITTRTVIRAEEEAPTLLRRWRSESFERGERGLLRRSESEKLFEISDPTTENADSRDELSNEDFNRTVDAFIAKQLKFRRQELVFPASSLCETSPEVSSLCSSLSTAINA